jgi:hypothetical protein
MCDTNVGVAKRLDFESISKDISRTLLNNSTKRLRATFKCVI